MRETASNCRVIASWLYYLSSTRLAAVRTPPQVRIADNVSADGILFLNITVQVAESVRLFTEDAAGPDGERG